ncbi:hypothetical protein JIR001_15410 [Polycladomyces abyssicola]|jgi:DNA-directed RNA polymerase subunit RPC12/RpoP|uniref:Uncharacterized protein n=1 Tax=Polycladomyces abyssicola TaxID=1125966 RepID=A0A8D5UGH6_9BACL|nr:hypothetical protein JIR001_15410 [Polycladomyces abyssicola]
MGTEQGERIMSKDKYWVRIRCKRCGERFILKGRMRKGQIETGFKQCLCDNQTDFDIHTERC